MFLLRIEEQAGLTVIKISGVPEVLVPSTATRLNMASTVTLPKVSPAEAITNTSNARYANATCDE